jgi:hypothetical protein
MHPGSAVLIVAGGALLATPLGATNSSPPIAQLLAMPLEAASGDLPKSESLDQPLTRPALDRQIERVLENPEFNWREPYLPAHSPSQKSLLDQLISSMRKTFLFIGNALNRLWKSLLKIFDFKHPFAERQTPDSQLPTALLSALTYLLWAALAGTLILLAIRLRKLRAPVRHPKPAGPPATPDLTDDGLAANHLPDDEWSALARQKIAAGEFRQALRALFLAILALLGSHHFIAIERWKSNRDYEKELSRKAKTRSDLLALFAQSRLGFERCWYGADTITLQDLESYQGVYERIKHAATDHR